MKTLIHNWRIKFPLPITLPGLILVQADKDC